MFSAVLVSFIALSLFAGVHADQTLSLKLTGPSEVQDVDNFAVDTIVTNTGSETIRLYKDPRSTLDNFPENTFTVTSDKGESLEFIGAYVKWSYKYSTDYVSLTPGESFKVTHQLGEAYNFTKAATYSITPDATFYAAPSGRNPNPVPIVASLPEGKHTVVLSGSIVSTVVAKRLEENARFLQRRSLEKRGITFNGCSASQKTTIVTAAANSLKLTANAVSKLTISPNTARYRKWFGTYGAANKDLVLNHYSLIQSGNPNGYLYDCTTCTINGAFAYVYPNTFAKVFLCPVFWTATALGTYSKAGTIVHESSHFTRNGGTRDYTEGQTNCAALANRNSSMAIMNAASHEFFAENTPALG